MSIEAGRLRHKIELQKPVRSQSSTGEMTTTWTHVADLWASIEPLSAREFIAAQSIQSKVLARITIRHTSQIAADMRIVYRGKIYNIEGILPDKESGLEYFTLPVSEGVNDG